MVTGNKVTSSSMLSGDNYAIALKRVNHRQLRR